MSKNEEYVDERKTCDYVIPTENDDDHYVGKDGKRKLRLKPRREKQKVICGEKVGCMVCGFCGPHCLFHVGLRDHIRTPQNSRRESLHNIGGY